MVGDTVHDQQVGERRHTVGRAGGGGWVVLPRARYGCGRRNPGRCLGLGRSLRPGCAFRDVGLEHLGAQLALVRGGGDPGQISKLLKVQNGRSW